MRFVGRGVDSLTHLSSSAPDSVELSWLEQVHGNVIATAVPGCCGAADALSIDTPGIAGVVATADCVPIAAVRGSHGVVIHAGWRGLAARLPAIAAARLAAPGDHDGMTTAWIGPAIGPCCYEVDEKVAEDVRLASDGAVEVVRQRAGRTYLDLRRAAALQLRSAGVRRILLLDHCTRCRSDWLWSYRREGERAGRNFALLWRR